TFGTALMGLTLECARCHDHKYDPITQREYYQFFAFFNQAADPGRQTRNGNEAPVLDLFKDNQLAEADSLEAELKTLRQQLADRAQDAEPEFLAWVAAAAAKAADQPLIPQDAVVWFPLDEGQGREVANLVDGSPRGMLEGPEMWADGHSGKAFNGNGNNYINGGDVGSFERDQGFSWGCWVKPADGVSGAPLARMDDGNGYRGWDLHLAGGTVQVHIINSWPGNAIKVKTKEQLKKDEWQHVFVTYDGSSKAAGVKVYINGVAKDWEIEQDGLTETIRSNVPLYIGRRNPGSPYKGLVDDVRLYPRTLSAAEVALLAGNDTITPLLAKAERTDDETQLLRTHFLTNVDGPSMESSRRINEINGRIQELRKPYVNVMIMANAGQMRETFVLDRGNYASPLKDRPVQPGVPAVLPPLPEGAPATRLGMAQWLVSRNHPLTARVAVNRYWAMLFGEGIVRSVEEFGAQGEWPSHPDLLDWLAVDFMDSGWDVKRMLKQLVMSSTYRQSSAVTTEKQATDPENRLLSRGARFRLQGEFVRDQALAVSGLLVSQVGGPGVKPYQPPGLWNEVSLDGNLRFVQDHGENLYRRSLYTFWKRSAPAPSMTIFDAPTREKCSMRRGRTNTPLQALVTLNDVQFVEAARTMGERIMKEGGEDVESRIRFAFEEALGRAPVTWEVQTLKQAYQRELKNYQANESAANALLNQGESQRDQSLPAAEAAAWTTVASMIFNTYEF
ncbi:MAG: DUF1553 domain-containing protein, partial [Planctomycetaceae bacterium]|nr:DUF1553 domain-containing protein [Planctomycetaceae bacterium]